MNPTNILRAAKSFKNARDRQLLWYLHSRYTEDGGFDKVAGEIETHSADKLGKIYLDYFQQAFDPDCKPGVHRDELISALESYCTLGAHSAANSQLLSIFAEFANHATEATKQKFHLTNVGSTVWETLDWCREERRPCFIEGHEGRGKSAAARNWYEAHRGEARYVSLPGTRTQRDFFDAIAGAYGHDFSSKFPGEVRWRVKDMIIRSGLILIIDEAHHALPERHRAGRPPLIDWIDCDLCNAGVPVVLISTPQFGPSLAEFAKRTNWNVRQFIRRFSGRWKVLDTNTTETDLATLAQQAMPKLGTKGVEFAVACAQTVGRDVSGLFDLVRDAERRARKAGRSAVTKQDLLEAFELDRLPSENAMANAFKPLDRGTQETLPDAGEPTAAPLQRSRASESEFTAPDRGTPAPLLVTH